ncbi:MAG TPA: twin-arginine translocase subunit TatC [Ktedonobacterales bacterium]|jgi:sec-independent protein translocase protein TatC
MATSELDQDQVIGLDEPEPPEEEEETGGTMSLVDHLEELRRRIIICAVTIVLGSIVGFIFWQPIMNFLMLPLPVAANPLVQGPGGATRLTTTEIGGAFSVVLKLSVAVGIGLGSPMLLYQIWAFVAPGLTRRERRWAGPFVLIGVVLFLAGLAVGFLTLRFPVNFLISFGKDNFLELITANSYFTFVAFFMLAFGIVFELPLVLTFLAQIGILSSQTLRRKRALALVILWILSTVITPGTDPYSPIVLGLAMTMLYELSIILIRVTKK